MSYISSVRTSRPDPALSPLVLSDRLIILAQDADQVGLRPTAVRLVDLAYEVLDRAALEFA